MSSLLILKNAFDTVDHATLLRKLSYCGFQGTSLNWFESYLKNRRQQYYVNGILSDEEYIYITYGVLQGLILGPLRFLIYINDYQLMRLCLGTVGYLTVNE